jgi:hypothetical protein
VTEQTTPASKKARAPHEPSFTSTSSTAFGRDISYIDAIFAATLLISNEREDYFPGRFASDSYAGARHSLARADGFSFSPRAARRGQRPSRRDDDCPRYFLNSVVNGDGDRDAVATLTRYCQESGTLLGT